MATESSYMTAVRSCPVRVPPPLSSMGGAHTVHTGVLSPCIVLDLMTYVTWSGAGAFLSPAPVSQLTPRELRQTKRVAAD